MRTAIGIVGVLALVALAGWAYVENYRTRDAMAERRALQSELRALDAEIAALRAEWALLNRPERLRALVALNHDALRLAPMTPEAFGRVADVPRLDAFTVRDIDAAQFTRGTTEESFP